MLEIVLDNEPLELDDTSPLNLSLKSRLIYADDQGSYSINQKIPRSPHNERKLRFANHTRVSNKTLRYDVSIRFGDVTLHDCTLQIADSGNKQHFNALLLIDGVIAQMQQLNIKEDVDLGLDVDGVDGAYIDLSDVEYGSGWQDALAYFNNQVWNPDGSIPFCFPLIYAPNWRQMDPNLAFFTGEFSGVLNQGYGNTYGEEYVTSYLPCLYLMQVLKISIEHLGWTLHGTFYINEEMRQLALFNTFCIDEYDLVDSGEFSEITKYNYPSSPGLPTALISSTVLWQDGALTAGDPGPPAGGKVSGAYQIQNADTFIEITIEAKFFPNSPAHKEFHLSTRKAGVAWGPTEIIDISGAYPSGYVQHKFFSPVTTAPDIGQVVNWQCWFDDGGTGTNSGDISDLRIRVRDLFEATRIVIKNDVILSNHMPDVNLGNLIDGVINLFNLKVELNPSRKTITLDFTDEIFSNPKQVTILDEKIQGDYRIVHKLHGGYSVRNNFQEGEDIQDATTRHTGVSEFYPLFVANYFPGGGYEEVDDATDMVAPPFYAKKIYYVRNSNEYFENVIEESGNVQQVKWVSLGQRDIPVVVGDGESEISSPIAPMLMTNFHRLDASNDAYCLMPMTLKKAWHFPTRQEAEDSGLQLFFYRGLGNGVSDSDANTDNPLATTHIYDFDKNVAYNYSMCIAAEGDNLYETLFRRFIEFLYNSEEVEMYQIIDAQDLFTTDFDKWILINGRKYLLKERLISIMRDKIKLSKIRLLKHG